MKKNILILGATSDIGEALVYAFAASAQKFYLAARSPEKLHVLKKDVQLRYEIPVETLTFDACDFSGHESLVHHLSGKLDVAISVFGYLGDSEAAKSRFSEAERIIDTNYKGAVSLLNLLALDFSKRKTGSLIGISSVAGDRGRRSNYLYGSAKAALTVYLSGLRNSLHSDGVHVMTVKPGFVRTRMTQGLDFPAFLTASPRQVAEQIYKAYLARKDVLYTPSFWRLIMAFICHLPEKKFKKMSF